jgi:hypothetical protein
LLKKSAIREDGAEYTTLYSTHAQPSAVRDILWRQNIHDSCFLSFIGPPTELRI